MEITGRIVKDASVFKLKENREVVNFTIAVNDSYKPKDSTELKKNCHLHRLLLLAVFQNSTVAQKRRSGRTFRSHWTKCVYRK